MATRRNIGLSLAGGWALVWGQALGWALPSGEVIPGGGVVSYGYQIGGLGEYDDSGHHWDVDFGVSDQIGVGLSLSRMSGQDRNTGGDLNITIGSIYGKFQFLEAPAHTGALSAYLGYHWSSEQDETLSGVGLGIMGSTFTPSGLSLHGRLGVGTRPGNEVIEFEAGAAWPLRPELDAVVGLRTFSAGGENEGGLFVGVVYRFATDQDKAGDESW